VSGNLCRCSFSARLISIFLPLLCAVLLPTRAPAITGFKPINPDELKMTSEPKAPGAAAIIVFREVDRDDDRFRPHEDNYVRVKILKEEGLKYANVEIVFNKGYESIVNIGARTIKPDGTTVNFDGKVYEKTIVKNRGNAYLAKTFNLPEVEVGSVIEYYYTIDLKEHYVFDSHWILSENLFTKAAKFSLIPFTSPYKQFYLRWTWQMLPEGSAPKQGGPRGTVEMEAHDIPAFQAEDFMPPENEVKSRVDFVYDEDLPVNDPDKYWKRFGKQRNGALESFIGKRKAMEDAVGQIVSPNDSPEIKLKKIYDHVQQMRNTSYEIRKTEEEEKRDKEKVLTNVEDVWKRGYGDGIQMTWLFLALARAAGFEAYGCWVADRRQYFFEPKMMQSTKLDANVVFVKVNGKELYFDPGGAFTPFGMLTWSETGVTGLRLDGDGGTWIRTTLPEASESQIHRDAKLKLSDTGDLEGQVTVTYTGLEAMYRRLDERHEDETARKKYLEDSIKSQIPVAAEVEVTNKPDWTSTGTPLVAVLDVKIPGWASSAGKRAILPVGFFSAHEKRIFEHAERVYPIYFEYPYQKVDDVTVELPPGWQIGTVPQEKAKDISAVMYDLKVENGNGTVRVVRTLKVDILILETKYYPTLRNFFQVVRTGDEQQILVQPSATSASN